MSDQLEGRRVLVTGAARGLGRAIAVASAAAGADVALGVRDETAVSGLVAEIAALGRRALPVRMDVTDLPQSYAAVDRAIEEFGGLDVLVNNAGGGVPDRPIEEYTVDVFDSLIDLNVKSTFFLSQYVGAHFIANGGGSIVNIGSQAGSVALPGEAVYCLSKAAVAHLTKSFAVEWGVHGVRVNCVAPTFVRTDGTEEMLADPAFEADVIDRIAALHRIGEPREVADAVVFLASDGASLISGETLHVDGGWTAR
ncbi:SDR family NAD(P)-dependent oxidoreductase [Leifsonia sp. Le1]|uniref:SDR family NAD(P)-dependent oxidoreductase n=1 Tax=Leifsonia sp. Le1 TaxID=3404918 RepID=UPI003EC121C9